MRIKRVAIVGGGTSGWIVANHLGRVLKEREVSVDLLESPDIPPVGVGEGTVPEMRRTLQSFGISETDFIRRCDVSFKQSIKFVNWMDRDIHGQENYYHHLFESPYLDGNDLAPRWLAGRKGKFAEFVSPQGGVCDAGLAPKTIAHPEYQGELGYAYHLNASKFSQLLADNAKEKFSVRHIMTNVLEARLGNGGEISALLTDSEGVLEYDFYIDCTGFSSFLLAKALGVGFVDKGGELIIDTALVAQVPTEVDQPLPPYTVATAHQQGWIWDIALPERRGTGFVYSSSHLDGARAEDKFARYLGRDDIDFRKIPMKVGYRERFWEKNCVAIGLSQGFVEPLEATALLVTEFAARFLAERFPVSVDQFELLSKRYNDTLRYSWDRVVDFIKLHYFLSDREDSEFWLENRRQETLSDSLRGQLEVWQSYTPSSFDFLTKVEIFYAENFQYVLYGMGYGTKVDTPVESDSELIKMTSAIKARERRLLSELPEHRSLLEKIKRYGLQKI